MNVNKEIQTLLNNLWAAKIESIDFKLLSDKILLGLKVEEDQRITSHTLEFLEVSSYYYLKNTGTERFNFDEIEKGSFLELTSIDYYPKGIGSIKITAEEEWTAQYYSNANFALEIWNAILFIEAKIISLDGRSFQIKDI